MNGKYILNKIKFILFVFILLSLVGCNSKQTAIREKNDELFCIKETKHFRFYAFNENEKKCINDIANELESNYFRVTRDLNTHFDKKIDVKIYEDVKSLQKSIGLMINENEIIGYSGFGDIRIVSPLKNNETEHDYNYMLKAALHEFTHVVTFKLNENVERITWLSEGIADYEAGLYDETQKVRVYKDAIDNKLPKLDDLQTPEESFVNNRGHDYAYSIIEFIVKKFGYKKLTQLIEEDCTSTSFKKIFLIDKLQFMDVWKDYIINNYK